jgi:4'-phosphopantetheinyl transferase
MIEVQEGIPKAVLTGNLREIVRLPFLLAVDIEKFPAGKLIKYLNSAELGRMQQYRFEADQNRYLAGRAFSRLLLSLLTDIAPENIYFQLTEKGKPCVQLQKEIGFNFSHSGNMLAFVFSTHPCGIDVEHMKRKRGLERICKHYFHNDEMDWVMPQGTVEDDRFYQIWTRKEALLKATGIGVATDLKSIRLTAGKVPVPQAVALADDDLSKDYFISGTSFKKDYHLSFCVIRPEENPKQIYTISADSLFLLFEKEVF